MTMQTPTKHYIYLTTFPDGKVYCGKHTDDGSAYIGSGNYVTRFQDEHPDWRQMLKAGIITSEILEYTSKEMLNIREILWIDQVRRIYGDLCVNEANGGQGGNQGELWEERHANAMHILWQDTDFRERMSAVNSMVMTKNWEDPDFRERRTESNRKLAQDPVWIDHQAKGIQKKFQEDLDFRERQASATREATTKLWQDTDFRERNAAGVSKSNKRSFLFQNPATGEIHEMQYQCARRWHPDWICLGEVTQ